MSLEDKLAKPGDSSLASRLKQRIVRDGPISVADYMQACLADERDGYYTSRQPIGAEGDFVTAPEVSQIFGELLGLWAVAVWQSMGEPSAVTVAELGPGAAPFSPTPRAPGGASSNSLAAFRSLWSRPAPCCARSRKRPCALRMHRSSAAGRSMTCRSGAP